MGVRHGLQVRGATAEDADGVAELLRLAGSPIPAAEVALRLGALSRAAGAVLLAVEWGPPSGLVVVHWTPTLLGGSSVAWISTLVVDPDRRRNGIGRMLLKAAAQAARQAGCGDLLLSATPGADGLQEFAVRAGFEPFGSMLTRPLRKRQASN